MAIWEWSLAMKFFYTSEDRLKNNLPQSTRKFRRVAEFARDRMQEELRSGSGHIVYKDYITALDKYLIPFFGSYDVANINAKEPKNKYPSAILLGIRYLNTRHLILMMSKTGKSLKLYMVFLTKT